MRFTTVLAFIATVGVSTAWAQIGPAIVISGIAAQPLTLSLEAVKSLPNHTINETRIVGEGASREERVQRYTGVLLRDVLERAKLGEMERHDLRRTAFLITATDGYKVVFSWGELFNSPVGDGVLVAYERDGAALPAREGVLALVSLKDLSFGPRHVRLLKSIEVIRLGS
jgi:DMSO/TMAO reductase YedYZ molybdopterin-dependent catalytic subunit